MSRGVIYARQSVTRARSESLQTQIDVCRDTADRLGITVTDELIEPPSTSGYKARGMKRPRFTELLDLIRGRHIDVVVTYKSDRLSRGGGPGWAPLLDAAEAADLDLDRFVATPGGYMSEFEIGIRAATDREEARKIAERVAASHARRAERGIALLGGPRAFGYEPDRMTIRADEAALIREAATRMLAGETLYSIALDWNTRGLRSTTGALWQSRSIRRFLRSPRVVGLREHRGVIVAEATWPGILDRRTWDRIQAIFDSRPPRQRPARRHLLSGLAFCGRCNQRMVARNADARHHRYYACPTTPGPHCGRCSIVADPLEDYIVRLVLSALDDPERFAVADERREPPSPLDPHAEVHAFEAELAQLAADFGAGLLSRIEWQAARGPLNARLDAARSVIAAEVRNDAAENLRGRGAQLAGEWADRELGWQQAILTAIVGRLVVAPAGRRGRRPFDPGRVTVEWRR